MTQGKKKFPTALFVMGLLASIYTGYLAGGVWHEGITAFEFIAGLGGLVMAAPANHFGSHTAKAVLATVAAYAVGFALHHTSRKNLMPGREHGSAVFETPERANKLLMDRDDSHNRILSRNVRMSLDFRRIKLNGNTLVCGGSGAGKTFYLVMPNLMQMPEKNSFICLDPKGEILRNCGTVLKNNGYRVKVINLVEMAKSDCYNPFMYIREETDVVKLVTNLIANTTPKGARSNDPFWERAESLLLQALFYYVWLEEKGARKNFGTVMELLGKAEVNEPGKKSGLTLLMEELAETSPLGAEHPALKQYGKCIRGAGDTVRSIIISANSRLALLENKQILRILAHDEMDIADLGTGADGNGETRTALFCVVPDTDKSYNFVIGMLYTQIFQELYYQADFVCGGRLPLHVTFMMDEFCNVALPDDFCSLLSTMRSREISAVIIIQNFAQLKALFKDTWETIPGNCDTFIYLGGNEQSSHKYVSELLGKGTIDKRTHGQSRGRHGSSSRNFDVLGRELFTPDEVRKLDNKKCVIFVRGLNPLLDDKYDPFSHPLFGQTANGGGRAYEGGDKSKPRAIGPAVSVLSETSLKNFERRKEKGADIRIDEVAYKELMKLTEDGQKRGAARRFRPKWEDSIANRLIHWDYSTEQGDEARLAMEGGVPQEYILKYFHPDVAAWQMAAAREAYAGGGHCGWQGQDV